MRSNILPDCAVHVRGGSYSNKLSYKLLVYYIFGIYFARGYIFLRIIKEVSLILMSIRLVMQLPGHSSSENIYYSKKKKIFCIVLYEVFSGPECLLAGVTGNGYAL